MLGAIIGDIVGSRWEFHGPNDYDFELFSSENDFTDDTICTVGVADALLHGAEDYGKYIHEWCRKYPFPKGGYGGRFAAWVTSDNPKPYNSFGNGSAMRVSPIGWWFNDVTTIMEQAHKTAECSHSHPEGIKGAQSVALAIFEGRKLFNSNRGKITQEILKNNGLKKAVNFYANDSGVFELEIEKYRNRFDETCQGTVPAALWIVLNSKNFEDAIRQAVNLGADADTIGAITGSIAEAIWGIPEEMKEKALSFLPEEMKEVVNSFYNRK